jgi:hypothetical protein
VDGEGSQKLNPCMHGFEKSDGLVVPKKRPNNRRLRAEVAEGRSSQEGEHDQDWALTKHRVGSTRRNKRGGVSPPRNNRGNV